MACPAALNEHQTNYPENLRVLPTGQQDAILPT
jgi:hypothetical protein